MVNQRAEALQQGREAQGFRTGSTLLACPKR